MTPRRHLFRIAIVAASALGPAQAADAQVFAGTPAPRIQSASDALAQDAGEYVVRHGVGLPEAMRRLRAQEDSVPATDAIAAEFADRLTGVSIEHYPEYRIAVLLSGNEPVPTRMVRAGGMRVPVVFRTGAAATRVAVVDAITRHRGDIVAAAPGAQGMGLDPRTGELVLLFRDDVDPDRAVAIDGAVEALTGVPVRVGMRGGGYGYTGTDADMGIEGGSRVEGVDPRDGRRYACTTGFVVGDGSRTGVVTAAHCPDSLTYYDPAGEKIALDFVGGWGVAFQDVQVHVADRPQQPLFYAAADKASARRLTGARARGSTRAGDTVCHRGEASGYSCAEVELVDYAPPGTLCGGPCDPVWVTVRGPSCRGGDSGGPVFVGGTAFGITKGGSYAGDGTCSFYYYMSTDYLPDGWSLLTDRSAREE